MVEAHTAPGGLGSVAGIALGGGLHMTGVLTGGRRPIVTGVAGTTCRTVVETHAGPIRVGDMTTTAFATGLNMP